MRKLLRVPLSPVVNGVGRIFCRSKGAAAKIARTLTMASVVAMSAVTLPTSTVHAQNNALVTEAVSNYFVYFVEPGAAKYTGDVAGLPRTASLQSGVKFDASRDEVVSYRQHLDQLQTQRVSEIEGLLGRSLNVEYRYTILNSGVVIPMLASEVGSVAALPYVRSVSIVENYELDTDRGPWFIGADQIWSGDAAPSGTGYRGNGMVIGVLDTGVNTSHASFSNAASCGFSAGNPKLTAKDCLGSGTCAGANPVDGNGHGSHTASTAGGNEHVATGGALVGTNISGVAPCASLITYKVCATDTCDGAAINAAIETALVDQVDAVNYSISGGTSPWSDADRGFLDMVDAGIFVAASAGNTRTATPNPIGQVNHRGPWVMTVANSTHDRISKNAVSVAGGPQDVYGLKSTAAMPNDVSATVADSGALGNVLGCTAGGGFAAGSMTGKIGLISRGDCTFEEKINNAVAAGAIAVIVRNNNGGPPIAMGLGTATSVPSVMIPQAEGLAISSFVVANPTAVATIDSSTVVALDPIAGDVLNTGSLRGPIAGGIEVTKPDITGPGTNIFAAYSGAASSYEFLSGTSMSSPHVAGGGALVKGANPDWTVQEVKSAIQMTASKDGLKDFTNGTPNNGPWDADDVGNGRIDLSKAAMAGLVMNETTANHLAANGNQANQRALNIPSVRNTLCTPSCTFTRTVRNTLDSTSSWTAAGSAITNGVNVTVSPSSFTFTGDTSETQTVTITVQPTGDMTAALAFGEVTFTEAADQSPELHITVAIKGTGPANDGIFCDGFEEGGDGSCDPGALPPDINVTPASVSGTADEGTTAPVTATINIGNVGGEPLTWSEGLSPAIEGATVIWDQAESGTQGIVSDFFTAQNTGAYSANDFAITADASIATIQVAGFDNTNTLTGAISWAIYPDAAGSPAGNPETAPAAAVWTFTSPGTGPGVTISADHNITLDLAAAGETLDLTPGTYWLTVFPTYPDFNGNIGGQATRWNWSQATLQGAEAKLISPTLFGGVPTWTSINTLTAGALVDMAFTITGTTEGGGAECGAPWLSINPTSGTVAPAGSSAVTVSMNPTGLAEGTYTANVCIDSNDPDEARVQVPVTFNIEGSGGGGDIVEFNNVNFVPQNNGTGGSVRWHDGFTCQCDGFGTGDPTDLDFNVWSSSSNIAFFWPGSDAARGAVSSGGNYSVATSGQTIGPSSTFANTGSTANWRQAGNVSGYLGFRFLNPTTSEVNYGYARITSTGATGFPLTIVSWAFNSAGDPITIP